MHMQNLKCSPGIFEKSAWKLGSLEAYGRRRRGPLHASLFPPPLPLTPGAACGVRRAACAPSTLHRCSACRKHPRNQSMYGVLHLLHVLHVLHVRAYRLDYYYSEQQVVPVVPVPKPTMSTTSLRLFSFLFFFLFWEGGRGPP
jgi:hypothetical protein